MSILIKGGQIVNEGVVKYADIYIKNGRIEKIDDDISASSVDAGDLEIIDATGLHVLPGMIDDQVHFREPGLVHKGTIASESRAAAAGGITSVMEMPNVKPATIDLAALEAKYDIAAKGCATNYAFYLGATNDNVVEIKRFPVNAACGVKVFMGASTGSLLVNDPKALEQIFANCPVLIATHCEDTPTITENEARFRAQYGDEIPIQHHPEIRSEEACYLSSSYAVELAKKQGANLHVLHLTTEKELALFEKGPIEGKQITAEVCVHHLYFSQEDYEEKGSFIKCNPAIKRPSDRAALLQAVIDDRIDIIATDHAPHTLAEKQQSSYFKAPAGLPLVQHALISALEYVHNKQLTLPQLVQKIAHNVAIRYQVKERGYLREGYWADLALVDLTQSQTITRESVLCHCGWSPFEGRPFQSTVSHTLVNGVVVYERQRGLIDYIGSRLEFDR